MVQIGERIRKERENKFDESRPRFAERCGITENHLGKLERGELLISIKALSKICTATGINADYLLFGNMPHYLMLYLHNTLLPADL